jgi:hypothetical protein
MLMKSALFWGITRRRVVLVYHMMPSNTPEEHRLHYAACFKNAVNFLVA